MTAAILDTGIHIHPDFDRRILDFKDFVNKPDWMKSIALSPISLDQLKKAQQKVSGDFKEKGKKKEI